MERTYEYNTSWAKIERVFPKGTHLRVLDIGCGDGRVVESLIPQHEVIGIDEDVQALAKAKARGITTIARSITDPFPLADVVCDVVLDTT